MQGVIHLVNKSYLSNNFYDNNGDSFKKSH